MGFLCESMRTRVRRRVF